MPGAVRQDVLRMAQQYGATKCPHPNKQVRRGLLRSYVTPKTPQCAMYHPPAAICR
jgi:hypothetical protein